MQPSPTELADMARHANQVVRLLEDLRRMSLPESERGVKVDSSNNVGAVNSSDDHRPPKRPWEDMAQDRPNGADENSATTHEVRCLDPVCLLPRRTCLELCQQLIDHTHVTAVPCWW